MKNVLHKGEYMNLVNAVTENGFEARPFVVAPLKFDELPERKQPLPLLAEFLPASESAALLQGGLRRALPLRPSGL